MVERENGLYHPLQARPDSDMMLLPHVAVLQVEHALEQTIPFKCAGFMPGFYIDVR